MDRAHKIAQERLPINEADRSLEHQNQIKREIFCSGYYAAEKDFALTWEDLQTINDLFYKVDSENFAAWDYEVIEQDLPFPYGQKFYEEVLRRFREMKNK